MRHSSDDVIIVGLILGATFGIAGTTVGSDAVRQIFWAIDGVGVVVATVLLAVRFLRGGDDTVAAGFIVFAFGETLLISGTAAGLEGSVPSFGGGVALWSAGLLLISVPKTLAIPGRRAPVAFFEITHEVAFIRHPDLRHDLFDAQIGLLQQFFGLLHAEQVLVLGRRQPCLSFEELMKT